MTFKCPNCSNINEVLESCCRCSVICCNDCKNEHVRKMHSIFIKLEENELKEFEI